MIAAVGKRRVVPTTTRRYHVQGIWHAGKRHFHASDDGNAFNGTTHDHSRYGMGSRYRRGAWRVAAEYLYGKGIIFQGVEKPNFSIGPAQ